VRYASVVFDCDSTLVAVEGIDLLAGELRAEVEALTDSAMRGEVGLEEVYGRRLELIRPTRTQVEAVGDAYVRALVPGAREVFRALESEGISTWIVSGGLRRPVLRVAEELGVPPTRVAAVDVHFDGAGGFAGFDPEQLLARAGGKPTFLRRQGEALVRPALMVGDGVTDLEAGSVVDDFLAFAGVVDRPSVTAEASVVVRAPSLEPVFSVAVGFAGPSRENLRGLFSRGVELGWEDRRELPERAQEDRR
jgi:phosphoserine phosphatase